DWLMSPKKKEYFLSEKILIREISGAYLYACFDDSSYFANDTTHIILKLDQSMDLKYLLTVINSKLMGWFFKYFFAEENDLFPKIKINEIKELPIIKKDAIIQAAFIKKTEKMLLQSKQLNEDINKFINRLQSNFNNIKITNKIKKFYKYDFKSLLEGLNQKITLRQQDEWEDYFNEYKTKLTALQAEIDQTDREINQMVYELYGLTPEEIKIVEESVR
ncbi:restriction endonuclease subunit M, partial [candidate division KSB1 bacterium]|nr:restriction endonuclease subunit M [candidate division KSB1 bacterium]